MRSCSTRSSPSVTWQTMAFSMGGPMVFDPGCMMTSRIETVLRGDGWCLTVIRTHHEALCFLPVEPGNDLPAPGVVCVRGFARQPRALVTSRMEVRSALGPATTRAGGIKSNEGQRPIMKIPFRVLVWPNPLIEAIKSRAVHLGQLSPRS
jgi:hypothetical protein